MPDCIVRTECIITAMRPTTSLYRCKHCGKTVEREGTKQWRKSFCEKTGKNTHITKVKP